MRSLLLAVSLLLPSFANAAELYVPFSGAATTELRILNPSNDTTLITIELLGHADGPITRQITLGARETVETDAIAELFGSPLHVGALRITSRDDVGVTAASRCVLCGTTRSLPLDEATEEGELAPAVPANALGWESSIVIVNPDSVASIVTLALRRGEDVVDETSVRVAARGTRIARIDRMFRSATPSDVVTFRALQPVAVFGYDVNARSGARVFSAPRSEAGQRRRRAVRKTTSGPPVVPQTVVLTPSKDNTLYESSSGGISNGEGVHFFIGTTGSGAIRRAVLAFDLASQIPPGSQIASVTLTVRVSQTISGPHPATLHRAQADWGEGTSNAGSSRDGDGAAARAGDATWIHTFAPASRWTNAGGDFDATPDATTSIGSSGSFTWPSSSAMVTRVQNWLDQPATNFGWLIKGNEAANFSAKRLDSREEPDGTGPILTVQFLR